MCDESDGVIGIAIMNRVITCPVDSIHSAMMRVLLPSCLGAGHSAWIIGNDQNGYSIYDYQANGLSGSGVSGVR